MRVVDPRCGFYAMCSCRFLRDLVWLHARLSDDPWIRPHSCNHHTGLQSFSPVIRQKEGYLKMCPDYHAE